LKAKRRNIYLQVGTLLTLVVRVSVVKDRDIEENESRFKKLDTFISKEKIETNKEVHNSDIQLSKYIPNLIIVRKI